MLAFLISNKLKTWAMLWCLVLKIYLCVWAHTHLIRSAATSALSHQSKLCSDCCLIGLHCCTNSLTCCQLSTANTAEAGAMTYLSVSLNIFQRCRVVIITVSALSQLWPGRWGEDWMELTGGISQHVSWTWWDKGANTSCVQLRLFPWLGDEAKWRCDHLFFKLIWISVAAVGKQFLWWPLCSHETVLTCMCYNHMA